MSFTTVAELKRKQRLWGEEHMRKKYNPFQITSRSEIRQWGGRDIPQHGVA
jgi:hypothetical protein